MAKAEMAKEPSMEEILASIRQIIADDPADTPKNGAVETTGIAVPDAAQPANTRGGAAESSSGVDDILDLIDGAPSRNESTRTAATSPVESKDPITRDKGESDMAAPSWLFPRSATTPARTLVEPTLPDVKPASSSASDDSAKPVILPLRTADLGAFVPARGEDLKSESSAPGASRLKIGVPSSPASQDRAGGGLGISDFAAALAPETRPPVSQDALSLDDLMAETLGPASPAEEKSSGPVQGADKSSSPLNAFASLLRRSHVIAPAPESQVQPSLKPDTAPKEPVPFPAALAEVLRTPATTPEKAPDTKGQDAAAPSEIAAPLEKPATVEQSPAVTAKDETVPLAAVKQPETVILARAPEATERRPAKADTIEARPVEAAPAEPKALSVDEILSKAPPFAVRPASEPSPAAADVAAKSVEAKSEAAAADPAPASVKPEPKTSEPEKIEATKSEPANPEAPKAAPATQATQDASRTLEDAVSDLLRPMLRQWLDTNLPRLVEKALSEELAERRTDKPEAKA